MNTQLPLHHLSDEDRALITDQNGLFLRRWPHSGLPGCIQITDSIAMRPGAFQSACLYAVQNSEFTEYANDPGRSGASGTVDVSGETVCFCIDLVDENYEGPSPDPTDPEKTRRILRIYFPGEL